MIKELLNNFGKYFEDEKVVLSSYKLQNGIYYLFSKDGNLINKLEVSKDTDNSSSIYQYFKVRDFYSNYIDSNKAVENSVKEKYDNIEYSMNKKICSNNHLTLFFKNKFVQGISGKINDKDAVPVQIFKNGINEYFKSLANLGENSKKGEKEIIENITNIISEKEDIYSNKDNLQNSFDKVIDDLKSKEDIKYDIWIKVFTEASIEEYEKASNKYIALKLFNKNDNNVVINNEIYGINNYNFGLNSKKPFLELKSTPYKIGLIGSDEIRKTRNLYTWLLKNCSVKNYTLIPVDFDFKTDLYEKREIDNKSVYLMRVINDNGNAKVEDFEIIPRYSTKIRRFECDNYINNKLNLDNIYINTEFINELESFVSEIWFSKYLIQSYYNFKDSVSKAKIQEWKKNVLKRYSKIFRELFLKEDPTLFKQNLDKIASEITICMLKDEISKKQYFNASKSMCLWIALDSYFQDKEMNLNMKINNTIEKAKEIAKNSGTINDDKLYYFLVGQVTYYLVSLSRASSLKQDIIEPIIKSNNILKLKSSLQFLHNKYKHEIYLKNEKFNNIFSQILLNEPDESVKENTDMILSGILSKNIFFESIKEEEN